MTQPTHDEVIAYTVALDEELDMLIARYDRELRASRENGIYDTILALRSIATKAKVKNLTNRAVLERHKRYEGNQGVAYCDHCLSMYNCGHCAEEGFTPHFPCPTYTDIYDPIVSVM